MISLALKIHSISLEHVMDIEIQNAPGLACLFHFLLLEILQLNS